jgi:hypothetical protein
VTDIRAASPSFGVWPHPLDDEQRCPQARHTTGSSLRIASASTNSPSCHLPRPPQHSISCHTPTPTTSSVSLPNRSDTRSSARMTQRRCSYAMRSMPNEPCTNRILGQRRRVLSLISRSTRGSRQMVVLSLLVPETCW